MPPWPSLPTTRVVADANRKTVPNRRRVWLGLRIGERTLRGGAPLNQAARARRGPRGVLSSGFSATEPAIVTRTRHPGASSDRRVSVALLGDHVHGIHEVTGRGRGTWDDGRRAGRRESASPARECARKARLFHLHSHTGHPVRRVRCGTVRSITITTIPIACLAVLLSCGGEPTTPPVSPPSRLLRTGDSDHRCCCAGNGVLRSDHPRFDAEVRHSGGRGCCAARWQADLRARLWLRGCREQDAGAA